MRTVLKWINVFLVIGIFIAAAGIAYAIVPYFGNQALIVRSGSMVPAIGVGSVVVVRPEIGLITPQTNKVPLYSKNDIIVFRSENDPNTLITHRVVRHEVKENGVFYQTKGDANEEADNWLVREKDIIGKTFFTLPLAGYVLAFAKSNTGFPLLIIIPAVFVMLLELINVIKELRGGNNSKLIAEIRAHLHHHAYNAGYKGGKIHLSGLKILVPILLIGMSIPLAFAFPGDTEKSTNNIFTAARDFPTPPSDITPTPSPTEITNHLVISEVQIDGGIAQDNDNDFIELYNPTSSAINLDGFRLVKRAGNSGNDINIFTFTSSHVIPAHGYFLWGHQSGGQNPNNFATAIGADVASSDTLEASSSIAIRQGDLGTGTIIDALSWDPGASSLNEGTQFQSNPQENKSLERKALSTSTALTMVIGGADEFKGNGFDLNDNSTDFILRTLSQPQNSTSSVETL